MWRGSRVPGGETGGSRRKEGVKEGEVSTVIREKTTGFNSPKAGTGLAGGPT